MMLCCTCYRMSEEAEKAAQKAFHREGFELMRIEAPL